MSIQLTASEIKLRDEILERLQTIRSAAWGNTRVPLIEAGERAHELHLLLRARNLEPKHHAQMIKNRCLQPSDPQFYMQFHALEDLLRFIDISPDIDEPAR